MLYKGRFYVNVESKSVECNGQCFGCECYHSPTPGTSNPPDCDLNLSWVEKELLEEMMNEFPELFL